MIWLLLFFFILILLFIPKKLEIYTKKGTDWFVYILLPFRIRLIYLGIGIKDELPYLELKILNKTLDTDIKSIFKKKHGKSKFPYGIIKTFKIKKLESQLYTGEADSTAILCGVFNIILMNFNARFRPKFGANSPFIYLKCIITMNPGKILIELIKNKKEKNKCIQ